MPEFKKILVAVKDSANSIRAAKYAFALAQQLQSLVAIVSVVDKSREVVNADLGITPQQSSTVLLGEAEKNIAQLIELYSGREPVSRFTPEGIPEKEILNIAREWEADLIVTGASVHSGLGRLLSVSVPAWLVRHTMIPVLVVPAGHSIKHPDKK